MESQQITNAYEALTDALRKGGFAPPGEGWPVEFIAGHVALNNELIAAVTECIAAGDEPSYDNRSAISETELHGYVEAAGDLAGLADALDRSVQRLVAAWSSLDEHTEGYLLPATIVDGGTLVHEGPIPITSFLEVNSSEHLRLQLDQLLALRE